VNAVALLTICRDVKFVEDVEDDVVAEELVVVEVIVVYHKN
jgi:hypothetical protein